MTQPQSRMIFINLPVTDLARSIAFYSAVGAVRDDRFADATSQCMTFSQNIHVMLLTHEKFSQFTPLSIIDAHKSAQVLLALSADSREDVEATVERALAAGGTEAGEREDYGFMVSRPFADPDGHAWNILWMDMNAFLEANQQAQPA